MTNPRLYHVCTSDGGSYMAGLERIVRNVEAAHRTAHGIAAGHANGEAAQLTAMYVHTDTRLAEVVWTIAPLNPPNENSQRYQMSVWLAGRVIDQAEFLLPA